MSREREEARRMVHRNPSPNFPSLVTDATIGSCVCRREGDINGFLLTIFPACHVSSGSLPPPHARSPRTGTEPHGKERRIAFEKKIPGGISPPPLHLRPTKRVGSQEIEQPAKWKINPRGGGGGMHFFASPPPQLFVMLMAPVLSQRSRAEREREAALAHTFYGILISHSLQRGPPLRSLPL